MNGARVSTFIRNRCGALDENDRKLVREVLTRLPEDLDVDSIQAVLSVYLGIAHESAGKGWILCLDWNVLHRASETRDEREGTLATRRAHGVIALNLAHFALKHGQRIIHRPRSYLAAKRLAQKWGFREEIDEMERAYL